MVITHSRVTPSLPGGVTGVADGWVETSSTKYDNLVAVPLESKADVRCYFELVNAEPLLVSGYGLAIRLVGPSAFVEDLPSEWAPADPSEGSTWQRERDALPDAAIDARPEWGAAGALA